MLAASYMLCGKSCKLAKYKVIYMGIVDQMFITMITCNANDGSCKKLILLDKIPISNRKRLMGPFTLNMNIKIMVNAELEVNVGKKYTTRKRYLPLIPLLKTAASTSDKKVCIGTTTAEKVSVFLMAILATSSENARM
jgi:hypothetical protein